jgi:hypothetical protein
MKRLASLLLLAACGGEGLGEARFPQSSCRAVQVVSGAMPVMGIEDIVLGTDGNLLLSAYDRLENGQSARGVFRLSIGKTGSAPLQAEQLLPKELAEARPPVQRGRTDAAEPLFKVPGRGATRPHGIDRTENGFVLIDHREGEDAIIEYSRAGTVVPDPPGNPERRAHWGTIPSGSFCAANDIASYGEAYYVTIDREDCRPSMTRRLTQVRDGKVLRVTELRLTTVMDGLALPNGIAEHGGRLWIAEMRARRLVNLDRETIDLPGAPDNLNASPEGIVAALQPSLWRFGLYRYGYTKRAPTRIVLVDPATEEIELLYDDPKGSLLAGATASVLTANGMLIASSVGSDRLLICEPRP